MALPVAKLGDTRIYVHITFLFSAIILALSGYMLHLAIFAGSLLVHETGHLVTASLMGAQVTRVEIWPFGAVGKVEHVWQIEPVSEAVVALFGPVHSGILASVASVVRMVVANKLVGADVVAQFPLLDLLIRVNLGFFLINLVPCLPLDGGRFLRSRLAMKMGYIEASKTVARWGLWFGSASFAIGIVGIILGLPWYILLALGPLLIWGAMEEKEGVTFQNVMWLFAKNERLLKQKTMPVEEILVSENACVRDVILKLKPSKYHVILVAGKSMKVRGKVSETKILEAFYKGKLNLRLRELCEDKNGS